jgi:hypothetical protein
MRTSEKGIIPGSDHFVFTNLFNSLVSLRGYLKFINHEETGGSHPEPVEGRNLFESKK